MIHAPRLPQFAAFLMILTPTLDVAQIQQDTNDVAAHQHAEALLQQMTLDEKLQFIVSKYPSNASPGVVPDSCRAFRGYTFPTSILSILRRDPEVHRKQAQHFRPQRTLGTQSQKVIATIVQATHQPVQDPRRDTRIAALLAAREPDSRPTQSHVESLRPQLLSDLNSIVVGELTIPTRGQADGRRQ